MKQSPVSGPAPMEPAPSLAGLGRFLERGPAGRLFFFDSAAVPPQSGASDGSPVAASRSSGAGDVSADALPLVLVHGLGDEADSFRLLLPLLAGRRRVLAPDLPGFGRSEAKGRVTLRRCVEAVLALVEAELPGGAVLAGSSLGAAVAELAALRRPDLARGLVLMDGGLPAAPGPGGPGLASILPGLAEAGYRAYRGRPEAAYESLRPFYADLDALPGDERAFLAARVVERVDSETQLHAYFSLFRSLVAEAALHGRRRAGELADSPVPLLVLWGGRDAIMPRAGAELLARVAPRARVGIIEDVGHLPQQEAPRETASALEDFLALLQTRRA